MDRREILTVGTCDRFPDLTQCLMEGPMLILHMISWPTLWVLGQNLSDLLVEVREAQSVF